MTPEALRDYLVSKGFSEDIAQDIIVSYLTTPKAIRYPKTWAWERAVRLRAKYSYRAERSRYSSTADSPTSPTQLRRTVARQELSRVMLKPKPPTARRKGKGRVWGWPKHQADYRALLKHG